MKAKFLFLASVGLAASNAMACYTVYDASNQVVYNAQTAPVDMSRPLHETLPAVFPGGHMVFDTSIDCPVSNPQRRALVASAGPGTSPLLTDRRTAEALGLPHRMLSNGVVLVSRRPDNMSPGLVIAESASQPVARTSRPDTVITEMHNPPMTVVQTGGMIVSEIR
jgi:hypothetical protein